MILSGGAVFWEEWDSLPCKAEQPLQGMEFWKEKKDEKHVGKLLRKNS